MKEERKLNTVILSLGGSWDIQGKLLKKKMEDMGITCIVMENTVRDTVPGAKSAVPGTENTMKMSAMIRQTVTGKREELLVITDDREMALQMRESSIACVGCAGPEEPFFDGVDMVTGEPEELEAEELEEYLLHFHGLPVTAARTKRLLIREIIPEDFSALHPISTQPGTEYLQALPGENCFESDRLEAYIRHVYRLYGYGLWSVIKAGSKGGPDELIGCCGLSDFEPGSHKLCGSEEAGTEPSASLYPGSGRPEASLRPDQSPEADGPALNPGRICLELQYMVDEKYRRQGYGLEMCRAILERAFDRYGADEVWMRIHPDNVPSLCLARKLGFVRVCREADGLLYFCTTR